MFAPNPSGTFAFLKLMKRYKKLFWWESIIFVILGLVALAAPVLFSLTLDYFLGWLCVLASIVLAVRAFKTPEMPNRASALVTMLLYLIVGILLILYPRSGILTLDLLLGVFFVLDGSTKIYSALKVHQENIWGWLFVSGCLSLFLAGIIFASWPSQAAAVLGILVGINIMFTGLSQIGLLWSLPEDEDNE